MKKNIMIIVLATLVLVLGGYLVYDKIIAKDETKKSENNEKVEEKPELEDAVDYDLTMAKKLIDKYTYDFYDWQRMFENGLDENHKILLAIRHTKSTKKAVDCKKAFPNGKLITKDAIELEMNGEFVGVCEQWMDTLDVYSYDELNKTYQSLFGPNEEMPKSALLSPHSFAYSSAYDAYIELDCQCGGVYFQESYYEVVSAKELDGTLIITVNYAKFVFSDYEWENPTEIDLNKKYNEAVKNGEYEEFVFTFKNSDNGYYLTSMSK